MRVICRLIARQEPYSGAYEADSAAVDVIDGQKTCAGTYNKLKQGLSGLSPTGS